MSVSIQHYFSGESSAKAIFFIKLAYNCRFSFVVHCQLRTDCMVVWFAHFNRDYAALLARFLWTALSPAVVLESEQIRE